MSLDAFVISDYELKAKFLSDQYQRMCPRFNFFVTIESAFIGGKFVFGNGQPTRGLALVGTGLSLAWYLFGAQDRYLVRIYERHVQDAADSIKESMEQPTSSLASLAKKWLHVGEKTETIKELQKEDQLSSGWKRFNKLEWSSGWRSQRLRITRLAALFPLLVLLSWTALLFGPQIKAVLVRIRGQ